MRYALLFTPAFIASLIFVGIAQIIVASSTYFIAKLASSSTDGNLSLPHLIGFITSLIIVLIPLYFSSIYLERAKFDALLRYHQAFEQAFLGKACHHQNTTLKTSAMAMLAQESKLTIDSSLDDIFDIVSLVANVVLNLFVIAWVLDVQILAGYAIGVLLAMGCVRLFHNPLKRLATQAQQTRLNLLSRLSQSWDNVVIFNPFNHACHHKRLNDEFWAAKDSNVQAKSVRYVSANSGMMVLLVCVLGATGWLFYQHWHDVAVLVVLVATLPRQIQMLQMSHQIISYQAQISQLLARLTGLFEILQTPNATLDEHIQTDKIIVKQTNRPIDLNALMHHPPKTGRITLAGQNGVGKSCVLLTLKNHYQTRANYLPAKHSLCFDDETGSTGQKHMHELLALGQGDAMILLLDEWDANLDNVNQAQLDTWLDELAKHKLIIEVRH